MNLESEADDCIDTKCDNSARKQLKTGNTQDEGKLKERVDSDASASVGFIVFVHGLSS